MKIITLNDTPLPEVSATVVTVGNFDGVHRGHNRLLTRAASLARERGAVSAAVTFVPHTRSIVYPELSTMLLTTPAEKAALVEKNGVDYMLCIDFDEKFRAMSQEDFITEILIKKLRAKNWVMGVGHHVGKNFDGAKKNLRFVCDKYHINVFEESLETTDGAVISSTRIRGLVRDGRIAEAALMLGHPYLIAAERVEGLKIASKKLGYPTLNFKRPGSGKVIPPAGVYAAEIEISDIDGRGIDTAGGARRTLRGALYFGDCPTYAGRDTHFEFHALFYDGGIREPAVGETVYLWLYEFVRPDIAFASEAALRERIGLDINEIKNIFSEEKQ